MSRTVDGVASHGDESPKETRRLQDGVRSLVLLVASCGAIFWVTRNVWEAADPIRAEYLSIQREAIDKLHSDAPSVRLAGILELVQTKQGDPTLPIAPLIATLDDPDAEVRIAGGKALGPIVADAVKLGAGAGAARDATSALVRSLKAPEPGLRAAAVDSLGMIAGVRPGLEIATPIDRKAVRDEVVGLLRDPDAGVRRAVIHTLSHDYAFPRTDDPPEELAVGLEDEVAENRIAATVALVRFNRGIDPWIPRLLRLAEHDPDPKVRERCRNVLTAPMLRPPAVTAAVVPALTPSLSSGDPRIRYSAAQFLYRLGPEGRAAIPDLLRLLREPLDPKLEPLQVQAIEASEDRDPASVAASSLGSIGPGSDQAGQVISALTEAARSGPLIRRTRVVYALGEFGPTAIEAVPVLIGILEDPAARKFIQEEEKAARESGKRKNDSAYIHGEAEAARALGKIAPATPQADRAVAALQPVLDSAAAFSRIAAAEALGRFGTSAAAAVPKLRAMKDDRDASVRKAAARALGLIEGKNEP